MLPCTPRRALLALATALASIFLAVAAAPAAVETKPRDVSHFNLGPRALALEGYDPVAYFPEGGGEPKKGLESISLVHDGVRYRFASEATKQIFLAKPAKFEPAYGGWCAYAMARGEKVEVDPESFLVTGDRLFLFYKSFFADTRAKWLRDEKALAEKADKAWKKIVEPEPKPGADR
jgi:hypothetical protein